MKTKQSEYITHLFALVNSEPFLLPIIPCSDRANTDLV